ncbi:NeuD/PglB/VioB family sugar acetyltransferase [Anatilimnocola floriformis]|uniref:NeuD/PglB/VioB family sugar acetyltransferase n=1 Tax=Anatilimnocola floriformis TaxID=2948575 RepID=UPI0020C46BA6|nr:NeuD/PglB/VioB family sugar acetyltransferase [Anatilimnocola floriformis]
MYSANHRYYNHSGDIFIFGAGGHAKTIASAVKLRGEHRVAAFVVDQVSASMPTQLLGSPVLSLAELQRQRNMPRQFIVGIGDNELRSRKSVELESQGFELVNIAHPFASIGDATVIGRGVFLSSGCSLDPEVTLRDGVIINVHAGVGHETVIGAYTHVSAGALIGAISRVGERCFFGMGSILISEINVGDDSYLGAGSVANKDVPANTIAVGSPARFRSRFAVDTTQPSPTAESELKADHALTSST